MTSVDRLDEESRGLLKKIVEGLAYRELMLANIRGHGLKFVNELDARDELIADLTIALRQFREIERLYARLGHKEVVSAVRDKTERIPYPSSRLELGLCLFLCERTSRTALRAYLDGSCGELAEICASRLAAGDDASEPKDPMFVQFCAEPGNRPLAQQLFQRWLTIGLVALGRPGTKGDERAVALGLRTKRAADIVRDFVRELEPLAARCGLAFPTAEVLGIELPPLAKAKRS